MSMTSSTTSNKKHKKSQNEVIVNKDRISKKRNSSKQPLFDQFNAIVNDANQQNRKEKSSKKQKYSKKEGVTVQEYSSDSSQMTNKKQKVKQPPKSISHERNLKSGSSYDESDDEEGKHKSDSANPGNKSETDETDSDNEEGSENGAEKVSENEAGSESNRIQDAVDSSTVDSNSDTNNDGKKRYGNQGYTLSPQLVRTLQWHARNPLFQRVKILDESHLEASGDIIEEALNKLKIDRSSKNMHAYINDCRQIIKRAMCSRRGYVKHEIGKKLRALIQDGQLSFELLDSLENFYEDGYENDSNVRKLWYLFCYHLLPRINKDWKLCLEGSRILQTSFMYETITTSDETMTIWFIKNWIPKLKEQSDKGWPDMMKKKQSRKGQKQGEQELKAGLSEYIKLHSRISDFKDKENGILGCVWNDIFWEEVVAHNPRLAKKRNGEDQSENTQVLNTASTGEILVLPGIDKKNDNQKMNLLMSYNMRKALKSNAPDNNNRTQQQTKLTDVTNNEISIQKENNNNNVGPSSIIDEITNSVSI